MKDDYRPFFKALDKGKTKEGLLQDFSTAQTLLIGTRCTLQTHKHIYENILYTYLLGQPR
jgi:hypothetical protein